MYFFLVGLIRDMSKRVGRNGYKHCLICANVSQVCDIQNLIKLYTLCEVYYISVIHQSGLPRWH